jgi:dTDP-4-dehydrorhamnose 3,5-epimerase
MVNSPRVVTFRVSFTGAKMSVIPLSIDGALLIKTQPHADSRGQFSEVFRKSTFQAEVDIEFDVKQFNRSVSHAGVVRGIHWTSGTAGQKKYVTCTHGAIVDLVVDLRVGSDTFGKWHAEVLTPESGNAIFIDSGLGHAFLSLKDHTIVEYLCSEEYFVKHEMTVNPLDPTIGIPYKDYFSGSLLMSDKDSSAPYVEEMHKRGLLPKLNK